MAKLRGCKVWRGILRLVWLGKFGMGAFLRFLFLLCAVATSAFGQGPQVKDGHPYIDDKSLLGNENGFRRWTYTIKPVAAPPPIASRGATTKEARVVEQAKFLLASREAKAIERQVFVPGVIVGHEHDECPHLLVGGPRLTT